MLRSVAVKLSWFSGCAVVAMGSSGSAQRSRRSSRKWADVVDNAEVLDGL